MARQQRRLYRQFDALARTVPGTRHLIDSLLYGRLRLVRVPLGFLLVFAGFLGFLPVLGFWMLPLGLLLLALDIPALQPSVSSALIRTRRRVQGWLRRQRRR